ncbi:hypothetical protein LPJ73_002108 [Coemansia sp. RSA 2703]|nr:hypothetical protein LPJ73_002108 [Coemansia sp. RSA 2703]KAJ2377817.1 hypothetical protein IW150_001167 [Coemansia sp. RSA 2607]KAJ2392543.1 hypothetical protein GGI05_002646 [Coemansia sp. RSA 2603]
MSADNTSSQKPQHKPSPQTKPQGAPKTDIPATRLFKVLNPELFMKPNKLIMYGGVVAMAGIVYWLGSDELRHRQEQSVIEGFSATDSKPQRHQQTYQERMAELKRSQQS